MRTWVKATRGLPRGVIACWHAVERGVSLAAVFQVGDNNFMAVFHPLGQKPIVMRDLTSFSEAQSQVNEALSTHKVIPRAPPEAAV
jgi:hypothetical protein